ncbi:hypothetical protein [Polaromonas sp. SM01]|uniref:hypothetical protein n=1 Tax=Polaromonas sp. SM01 TaxID=3085630 RepID=UPI0029812CBB|nr:hypothetical protein [Polaromonas sp. SM01]MDW5441531.1 hypothetical protein [Polaromonas sp. SM01]
MAAPLSTTVTIILDPGTIFTTNAAQALAVQDASFITNAGQITISGGGAALVGIGSGNLLTNNGSITTTGGGTIGITDGPVGTTNQVINNGAIATSGSSSHGIALTGPGNSVINTGTITVTGSASKGIFLTGGSGAANVVINSGTIHTTGNNTGGFAAGVQSNTTGGAFLARVENLANGRIISDQSHALRGNNGSETFINSGYLEGHGGAGDEAILMGAGGGTLILRTGSVIRGGAVGGGVNNSAFLEGSGTVDNNFRNFQNLTMRGTAWSWLTNASFSDSIQVQTGTLTFSSTLTSPVINVLAGSSVAGTGTFVGNVTSQGTLLPGPGAGNGFGALTVRGNYTGTNASLRLNAALGSDNSPANRLVIDGGIASGNTGVQVVNLGGAGASTTADGILLVQAVNGASTGGSAFALAQPAQAGAYDYRLTTTGCSRAARPATTRTTGTCGPRRLPWVASSSRPRRKPPPWPR